MVKVYEDETAEFWRSFSHDDLADRCAALHAQRRQNAQVLGSTEINAVRRTISFMTISGTGIEVGAGSRPFPIPVAAQCYYGDIRDKGELESYFSTQEVEFSGFIDAQTMRGVNTSSLDFVISAHVIEHLFDPIGSIEQTLRCLKPGGVFLLVVPEMTATWDRTRPPVTLEHLLTDWKDLGESTKVDAYIEHMRYVHPALSGQFLSEENIREQACQGLLRGQDIHVHAWRKQDFEAMLQSISKMLSFKIEFAISVQNENIFVFKKLEAV